MDHSLSDDVPLVAKVRNYSTSRDLRTQNLYPYFRPISSAQDTEVVIQGQKVLMLGSNSYLGLTNHPEVKESVKAAVDKYGSGCAGSPFLNGTLNIHLELAEALAGFVGKEAVLVFSTGFQANLGVLSAMVGRGDYVLADKDDHASIVDGCLLSRGHFLRFTHNDMASLEGQLQKLDLDAGKLIVVDGVFSMSGDIAPLPEIVSLAEKHRAAVMVDDAHAIGVLGDHGAGTASHFGLTDRVYLIMGTFSKSLASVGGFIASDAATIDYLKHNSRPLMFSASMSPANAGAVLAALKIMRREPERIERLWRNTGMMKEGLRALGFDTGASRTPVIPVHCRDSTKALKMALRLQEEGVFVNPVISPAVPQNGALIRISLMATHTESQINFALEKLAKVGAELGIIPRAKRAPRAPRIAVKQVTTRRELHEFIRYPLALYRRDTHFVPHLLWERARFFSRANPLFEFTDAAHFVARNGGGQVVGRVTAHVNQRHNEFAQENTGFFGFFESIEEPKVAEALMAAAEDWLRGKGMSAIRGPFNFSTNEECGFLAQGFDQPPVFMMPYTRPYYLDFMARLGYSTVKNLLAYEYTYQGKIPEYLVRFSRRVRERTRVTVRSFDKDRFEEDVAAAFRIYNAAWERNWGFVPMTEAEFNYAARELKSVVDPAVALVAEKDGQPVAFSLSLPDYNVLLNKMRGRFFPFGFLHFFFGRRYIRHLRVVLLGMLREYRNSGIDILLYHDTFQNAVTRGYRSCEMSWILEDNVLMRRAIERLGATVGKVYRIYEKAL